MKKILSILLLFSFACMPSLGKEGRFPELTNSSFQKSASIEEYLVRVPLGKIVLIRKGSEYCAVKFTEYWCEKPVSNCYAKYESYYQGDGSGDFNRNNVESKRGEVSRLDPFFWRCSLSNPGVRSGPWAFLWIGALATHRQGIYFPGWDDKEGDRGFEFAPTHWQEISEVNCLDPRIKWYRLDTERKSIEISVDELWEEDKEQKDK